jgi:hypothetical protein
MNEFPSTPGSPRFPTFVCLWRWLSSGFPTFTRLFRWLFSRRTLGRVLVGLAALATLIALVCAEENWRGKWAWERYKHQLEAQGEKLDWKDYVAPPVPDAQNFAMTPFLAPLFDFNPEPRQEGQSFWRDTNGYNRICSLQWEIGRLESTSAEHNPYYALQQMTDLPGWAAALTGKTNKAPAAAAPSLTRAEAAAAVLRGLEKYNPVVEELRSASQRPYARFNIHYDAEYAPAILLPHLAFLHGANSLFQVRASAELALDRTDQAWSDTKMALYLADTLKEEPFLISRLVQSSKVLISLKPIWEGLAEHKWSDAQLVEMEQRLGQINLLADAAMRGERAMHILTADQLRLHGRPDPEDSRQLPGFVSLLFGGYFYQNQLFITRMCQQFIVPVVDAANQRIYPSRAVANEAAMIKAIASGFRPYHLFARMLLFGSTGSLSGGITQAETDFGFSQTRVNEAIVACALERYRLAQRQFPESMEALSPRFLQKIPHDIITGAPLIYRRTADGQFILYSVGWNEKDDGGKVIMTKANQPSPDLTEGDWVWQYSAPAVTLIRNTARD